MKYKFEISLGAFIHSAVGTDFMRYHRLILLVMGCYPIRHLL
jgi:hypothetical protein